MQTIVGVRFKSAGKIYSFGQGELTLAEGDHVVVETSRGMECGRVVSTPRTMPDTAVPPNLRTVHRLADASDLERVEENHAKEREARTVCEEKIRELGLKMKLVDVELTFDLSKMLFYFTADGRIDFRELVKDLASVFKTRIELRQIGVRDETKIKGGIGICGRSLCCNTFLSEFVPVSIKMAKEQNLSLNPTKISGVCGRLMCCLKNEQDTYEYLNSKLPNVGDEVKTNTGVKGVVHEVSVLRQRVKLVVTDEKGEKELVDYKVDDLIFRPRKRREKVKMDDELKKLEAMEKKERKSKL